MVRHAILFLAALAVCGCGACHTDTPDGGKRGDTADPKPQALGPVKPLGPGAAPMFGGGPSRNMANVTDKNLPAEFSAEEGKEKNIKWTAKLGNKSYGGPVIAGGRIFIGTNNANPRDAKIKGARKAVLMCLREQDGEFLWQAVHEIPKDETFSHVTSMGLLSTPAVDGSRVYYVTPSGEVICADVENGKEVWRYDMMEKLKVVPFHCCNCSPLVVDGRVFIVTGNGIKESEPVVSPKAPSFIALDKDKGTLQWQSNLPGEGIIEGQWSNPTYAVVNGKPQVIFPGGDCILYSFEPDSGKLIWKFNCDPKREGKRKQDSRVSNYMIATPVVHDNRVYVSLGVYPMGHAEETVYSYVVCADINKRGDVSPVDLDAKNPKNKDSALVWAYGGQNPNKKDERKILFSSSVSTCAVHDGLVYAAEERGYLHCLDAKTGEKYWEHDSLRQFLGSPYCADGKVYLASSDGEMFVFAHGKQAKLLATNNMDDNVHSTAVAVNGVLYVMTLSKLHAIAK